MAKGPFMEYLRANVLQSAVDTFTEKEIRCPTSKTENMAMLIHEIEIHPLMLIDATPTNADVIHGQVTKKSKDALTLLYDPDLLSLFSTYTALNAVFNQLLYRGTMTRKFDPPILYPRASMFLGVHTAGMTATVRIAVRIGYTLEKVSREDFISALVE